MYKDREGNISDAEATSKKALAFLYKTIPGRFLLKFMINPGFSNLMAGFLSTELSSLMIDPFIKKNGISLKDYIPVRYHSFNHFFMRSIKPERRPVVQDANLLASPSDGKLSVYRINSRLVVNIKNTDYSVKSLLRDAELAEEFEDGYCIVIRLTVDNYHHYCYCDDGIKGDDYFIPGFLHTVTSTATDTIPVYSENARVYTIIDTANFGRMAQIEIGALGVGRIVNYDDAGPVKRGYEKGRFEFGGSTIVLLMNKDFIPDEDLIRNTAEGFETKVLMGERIGCNEKYKG